MTIKTISDSERDPSQNTEFAQSSTDAAVDRLAGLLPAEALEDALKGLDPDDITGPGGLLTQLAGRVIETETVRRTVCEAEGTCGGQPGNRSPKWILRAARGAVQVRFLRHLASARMMAR